MIVLITVGIYESCAEAFIVCKHYLTSSCSKSFSLQDMAQTAGFGRKYVKAFVSGFFIAIPVTVTALDRLAYVARVEGASMQVRD